MDGRGDNDRSETHEWLEALDDVVATRGEERARFLLGELADRAFRRAPDRAQHLAVSQRRGNQRAARRIHAGRQLVVIGPRQRQRQKHAHNGLLQQFWRRRGV